MRSSRLVLMTLALAPAAVLAQSPTDPFPRPIPTTEGVVQVRVAEFASIPEVGGEAARMMLLVDEPGTRRFFVNDMRGPLYTVSYDGRAVTPYLDVNARPWGHPVQSMGRERGVQSFAVHPQFSQAGTPGFGKLYVWMDTSNTAPAPDFRPGGGNATHHTVLLEFTARTPGAATYDGAPPRELLRLEQPFANHNAGHLSFHPLASPGSPEFGLLYVAVADGGSGGDPLNLAQNLGSPFGKLLRIDPLGGAHAVRAAGQHSPVGSRGDPTLNSGNRKYGIPSSNPFAGKPGVLGEILFGDFPSGEIFYISADTLPTGGQDPIRRILLDAGGGPKTLLQLIREKNASQGKPPASRADLRFGSARDGRVFLLNKHDGTIRLLLSGRGSS
jgi:hypothetical protein